MIRLLLIIVATAAFMVKFQADAIIQCPPDPSVIPCDEDCVAQHGSRYGGSCDGNHNCKCNTTELRTVPSSTSLQCRNGLFNSLYSWVCELDCQCFHGAVDGYCNFYTSACICGPDASEDACPGVIILDWVASHIPGLPNIIG